MKKCLKMKRPIITSYPINANILSILSDHPSFEDWLFNNHLQLRFVFGSHYGISSIEFYAPVKRFYYPLINKQSFKKEIISLTNINICEFFIKCIDLEQYVYVFVNTGHIQAYNQVFNKNIIHDVFIFGYDLNEKTFDIADFFDGTYSYSKTSFSEFEKAYYSAINDRADDLYGVQLLKVNYKQSYNFDLDFLKETISDYLVSKDTSKKFAAIEVIEDPVPKRFYGMSMYDSLLKYIESTENDYSILRTLHVLYDHKKLMKYRILFLLRRNILENKNFINDFEKLEKESLIIRNLFIKFSITRSHFLKEKVLLKIRDLAELEYFYLSKLLCAL